jgi:DNA-binding Xre family transcriptional regulator
MSQTIKPSTRRPGRPIGSRTRDPAERVRDLTGEKKRIIEETAERIKNILAANEMTYGDLAEALGMTQGHVSHLMGGSRNMTLGTLAKIGEAVGYRFTVVGTPIDPKKNKLKKKYTMRNGKPVG